MVFEIKYICQNVEKLKKVDSNGEFGDFKAEFIKSSNRLTFEILPKDSIQLISISATYDYEFNRNDCLFLNGYQSWTDSHEMTTHCTMHGLRRVPRFIVKKYIMGSYGDYDFTTYTGKKGDVHGFSYGYVRRNEDYMLIGSLSEREGFTVLYFNTGNNTITLSKDCKGFVVNKPYKAFDIALLRGVEAEVFDEYFNMMGIAKPKAKPINGYTSWYNHYQNINEDIIYENIDAAVKSPISFDVFQIDDGYQTHVGDWTSINKRKFPGGLIPIAEKIKRNKMLPGLWLAPFVCEFNSTVAKEHEDWLLKGADGKPVIAGGNWGGFYALDFYNDQVRDYIRECFDIAIHEWGFDLFKLDFLYAVCLSPDKHHTRGQITCEAMDFLRECAGDTLLLGCGVPLFPAFGKVDYCRIGCDVGLDYDDKPYMRLLHRERVSTKNAIGNTIYRRQLSGRAFINDPDVFLLRDTNIKLSRSKRKLLARVNSLFGGVLFTSDDISTYEEWQMKLLQEVLGRKEKREIKVYKKGKYTSIITDNGTIKVRL